jgi:hypothetical protein
MGNIIAELWNLLTPLNLIATTIVVALYTRFLGKQTGYLVARLGHPLHLLRGHWLCPACKGAGEGAPRTEGPTDWPCWVCLRVYDLDGMPRGYVRWRYLRHEWSWRGWHPRATYFHAPNLAAPNANTPRGDRDRGR